MDGRKMIINFFNAMIFSLLIISIKFEFSDVANKNPVYNIYLGFMFTVLNSLFTGMGFIAGISIFIFIKKKLKNEKFCLCYSRFFNGKSGYNWY